MQPGEKIQFLLDDIVSDVCYVSYLEILTMKLSMYLGPLVVVICLGAVSTLNNSKVPMQTVGCSDINVFCLPLFLQS